MKEQKRKPAKKRILLYYLILAVCILVIAAVTVTVVLAVTGRNDGIRIDNTLDDPNQGNPSNPDDDGPEKDTSSRTEFISPVKDVEVSQGKGPWQNKMNGIVRLHAGVDFAGEVGTEVYAAVDGRIKEISLKSKLDGNYIVIEHDNGIVTTYKFIDPVEKLKEGDTVSRGQVIGTISAETGDEHEEGPHLHFEVRENGKLIDPADKLNASEK